MSGRLRHKVAIVTGATDGIGLSIARLFVAEDAKLVLVARRKSRGREIVAELGHDRAVFVGGDVADSTTAEAAIAAATHRFGGVDVLVNNAAIDYSGVPILDAPLEDIREVFSINVFGAILMLQAAARSMQDRGGVIINVTSRTAVVGVPTMGIYGASKGALLSLTKAAALELAPRGVRVNAVAPGPTDTPLMGKWISTQADPVRFREELSFSIPAGRLASPDEVAGAVLYLASDDASYVTGASLPVDGGYTAG